MRWLLLFAISQAGDVATTGISMARGNHEMNPVAVALEHSYGLMGLLGIKLLLVAVVGLLLFGQPRSKQILIWITLIGFAVSVWNIAMAVMA